MKTNPFTKLKIITNKVDFSSITSFKIIGLFTEMNTYFVSKRSSGTFLADVIMEKTLVDKPLRRRTFRNCESNK